MAPFFVSRNRKVASEEPAIRGICEKYMVGPLLIYRLKKQFLHIRHLWLPGHAE